MKKILLSAVVIGGFAAYALFLKINKSQSTNITQPQNQTTVQATPSVSSSGATSNPASSVSYKDGTYTGDSVPFIYGNMQVKAVVSGGKITDVQFVQYPTTPDHSLEVNTMSNPILKQEAISAQSAQVDTVSGATQSSEAFVQSLFSALKQAQS